MAYKRKTYKKKIGKYTGVNRYKNYYRGGRQLYKDVMLLKSLINTEKKFIDTPSAGATLPTNTNGTLILLNALSQGTAYNQRTGISIKIASIEVEGFCTLNASATTDFIRVSLIQDKQPNGSSANYGNVYDLATAVAPLSFRNQATVDRFVVLKNWKIDLDTNGRALVKFKCYLKLNEHTKYNAGNAGTIADIATNAFYLTFAGNLSANFSTINYNCRIRFIDN